jgi:uncharacterized protein DUF4440
MAESVNRSAARAPPRYETAWPLAGLPVAQLLATAAAAAPTERVEDRLRRMTQEFSDAGLTTKAEILEGATPSPPAGRKITVTEFEVRVHGPIAVATFIDVLTYSANGPPLQHRDLSTEVWRKAPVGWRIIASRRLPVGGGGSARSDHSERGRNHLRGRPRRARRLPPGAEGRLLPAGRRTCGGSSTATRKDGARAYINRFEGHDTWNPRV